MTHPIYRPPQPPLTKEDVEAMIADRIAAHAREGLLASAGGAVVLGAVDGVGCITAIKNPLG